MDELKKLIEAMAKKFAESQEARVAAEKALKTQLDALNVKYEKLEHSKDPEEIKKLMASIKELEDEVSDVRTKANVPAIVMTKAEKQKLHDEVLKPVIGKWLKGKKNATPTEFFKYVENGAAEQFKALNITNASEGGLAVAEVLSRDVIEYAREFSPILGQIGRKPSMTRNFRELILVSYPSVQEGIENVAGVEIAETTTQEYKEVKSKEFKVSAKPRMTDEAMFGADIDLYGDLIRLLGRETSIYTAAQVLYGNGTGKNARGILSSNRVDITNGTGESFKPTLAADPANARDADFYPVVSTGVSGALGADDEAIVNFFVDLVNTLPTQWLAGAKFHMNRTTKGVIQKVRDADNRPVYMNSYAEGGELMMMGYPVVIDDTLPNLAADSTPIIFGNLSAAFAMNDGDIDKMLIDPYTVDECTVVKYSKEYFEMVQNSDAILIVAATTNVGA
jgi:HK97 family phage major capsid protein